MITIQVETVAELRKVFTDLFGTAVMVENVPVQPKAAPKTPPKKTEPKVEDQIPGEGQIVHPPEAGTVTVEVPEETSGGREATYEEVIALVKKLKASTVPDILDRVNAWKTKGGYPALKESSPEQLGNALTFIESLEG